MARWLSLLILPVLVFTAPLRAEVTCTGHDCGKINRDYGDYFTDYQKTYLPILNKDIIVSQAIAAVASVPYHVTLNRFAVGAYATVGWTTPGSVPVQNSRTGEYKKIDEMGLALQPNLYAGINLGWAVDGIYDWVYCPLTGCGTDSIAPVFLKRIDIYIFGTGKYEGSNKDDRLGSRRMFSAEGAMIRYADTRKFVWHSIIEFSGVSGGVGFYRSRQKFRFMFDDKLKLDLTDYAAYDWSAKNKFEHYTKTETVFGDIRTGFKVLDAFGVYAGFGTSFTRGYSEITFSRDGYILTPLTSTYYRLSADSRVEEALKMDYVLAGASVGPITLQGVRSINPNPLTQKFAYAVTLAFTFDF